MSNISEKLDKIASALEEAGNVDLALKIDTLSDKIELGEKEASKEVVAAEELIASEYEGLEIAFREVDAANEEIAMAERAIEAARTRKRKWTKGIDLKKGRLTSYKKPGESMEDAAKRALNSDDPSVRGMGSFFFAAKKMRHQKGKKNKSAAEGKTKAENRPSPVFESTNPKVKDDKDHFPIQDEAHGRNALARVNQYSEAPEWYDGSLEDLKKTVADAVKNKFPDIEVTEESYKS